MMQRRFAAQTFMVSQQFLFLFCKLQQVQPRSDLVLCLPTLICKSDLYLSESSGEKPLQHTDHLANCTTVCKITSPRDDKRIRPSVFVSVGGLLISRGTNFAEQVSRAACRGREVAEAPLCFERRLSGRTRRKTAAAMYRSPSLEIRELMALYGAERKSFSARDEDGASEVRIQSCSTKT